MAPYYPENTVLGEVFLLPCQTKPLVELLSISIKPIPPAVTEYALGRWRGLMFSIEDTWAEFRLRTSHDTPLTQLSFGLDYFSVR
jgi:hypothetical protein